MFIYVKLKKKKKCFAIQLIKLNLHYRNTDIIIYTLIFKKKTTEIVNFLLSVENLEIYKCYAGINYQSGFFYIFLFMCTWL